MLRRFSKSEVIDDVNIFSGDSTFDDWMERALTRL